MEAILFDAIPMAIQLHGGGLSPKKICGVVKNTGVIETKKNGTLVILISRLGGKLVIVPSTERDKAMVAHNAVDLRDVLELPRYAAMYTMRETTPPTIIPDYTSALTGWRCVHLRSNSVPFFSPRSCSNVRARDCLQACVLARLRVRACMHACATLIHTISPQYQSTIGTTTTHSSTALPTALYRT